MIAHNKVRALAFAIALSSSGTALAGGFGERGSIVPSGDVVFTHSQFDGPPGTTTSGMTSIYLLPQVRYFVLDRWSVGLGLHATYQLGGNMKAFQLGGLASTGYFVPLTDDVGLFPELALSVIRDGADFEDGGSGSRGESLVFEASLPLLFHASHFFIGAGPQLIKHVPLRYEIRGEPATVYGSTSLALATTFGGWF